MRRFPTILLILGSLLALTAVAAAVPADEAVPFVRMQTEEGTILIALFPDLAPHHAANFQYLAETGFFNGTAFHRIVPGFVIQGGDPNSKDRDPRNDGHGGPTLADVLTPAERDELAAVSASLEAKGYTGIPLDTRVSVKAEFSKTAMHLRGTLSMARSNSPDSAGSQFFICVDATPMLDRQYTVFGQVVTGMDVADAIVSAPTDPAKGRESPAEPIQIVKCEVTVGVSSISADEQAAYRTMLKTIADGGSTW